LEKKKGEFVAIKGAIDRREPGLLDVALSNGFESMCGVKGGKLSGGQK